MMIATAFMGYSLVWGQMSFWRSRSSPNLFSSLDAVVPGIAPAGGMDLGRVCRGGPTLTRLYSLHYLFPFLIAGVVCHIWALHIPAKTIRAESTSRGPAKRYRSPLLHDQDGFALALFALFFACFVFYRRTCSVIPTTTFRPIRCRRLRISCREWYFCPSTPSCADPSKLFGVIALISSIAILLRAVARYLARALDQLPPDYKWFFWAFVLTCICSAISARTAGRRLSRAGRILTAYYFLFSSWSCRGRMDSRSRRPCREASPNRWLGPQETPVADQARASAPSPGAVA